ncbi:MAG TPA: FtsQ-type POTRA domain-containing protein [Anaerolineales bacterium]|nr:FtsQ-type POTRA domain-containing protein [Anaerolineales bacterium]
MTAADSAAEAPRTHAEEVRHRRVHGPRSSGRGPRPAPPGAARARRPRRILELALASEIGAGLRLPALPAFRVGARILSATLTVVCLWALVSAFRGSEFKVDRAVVPPTKLLSEAQIRSIADVDSRPVFLIDAAQVRARLLAQPEIQSAQVVIRWPNHVELTLEERRPMIEWDDAGQVWWLSADGVAFLKHGDLDNLIRVKAETPSLSIQRDALAPVIDPQRLWAAGALLAQAPEVEVLQYHPDHGFGFTDPAGGWKAYFGDGGDMVLKMQLYRKIAEVLTQRGIAAELVSVEDPSAPYYRKK